MKKEVVVIGAGIAGTCTAVQLALRGHSVTLLDRKSPGRETSYGNAGVIQRDAVEPAGFPQDWGILLRAAFKIGARVSYHGGALPGMVPILARYWSNSRPAPHAAVAKSHSRLIEHCLTEHGALIAMSGADDLIKREGYRYVYRKPETMERQFKRAQRYAREYGVRFSLEDSAAIAALEPALRLPVAGALHWLDAWTVNDPGALVGRYADLLARHGGRVVLGDAETLQQAGKGWRVESDAGRIEAEQAVIAMGPWSADYAKRLGYRFPLIPIRGYHCHYDGPGPALPTVDVDGGYMVSPMQRGSRITTGGEFGHLEAPSTPVQLARAEKLARDLFGLGERVEATPWRGARPCMVDLRPVMGPAPRHPGLWFNFGHAHQGFTLGPVAGRLVAEMMEGGPTFVDPAPYAPARFD
ncbi:NAD(P)/FAD-dependent oxidoreductase [Caenimonas aquaedulcis]|uniref:FAD-binding oxidoreductase n=1 Tax=Caenimonas aquaedulcis TaxID=2793270 RepID=A0A931H3N8_9BURK|nr:FAD-binding oxidoreductase [Caenimonas aquaedulcis]MBG9387971.1 FAD-binding oxidoreductase [Caenimonas aquaedulcis]